MSANLTIRGLCDAIVQRLRARAERRKRSLQDELMAILAEAVQDEPVAAPAAVLAEVRRMGLSTPAEAASIVRAGRDAG